MKHSTIVKSIGAIFVLGSLLSVPQISLAANTGLDRSIAGKTASNIRRVHPAPVQLDFSQYIDKENSNLHYEDESIAIDVMPIFDYVTLVQPNGRSAHVSDYDNVLYMYGQNHNIISILGVGIKMENKTDQPLVVDINKSSISIGSYQGKILLPGTRFVDESSSVYAPIVIAPSGSAVNEFFRADLYLGQPGALGSWTHPIDIVSFDTNVLGDGSWALSVNDKYIMPKFSARLSKDKMASFIKTKDSKK